MPSYLLEIVAALVASYLLTPAAAFIVLPAAAGVIRRNRPDASAVEATRLESTS